MAVEIRTVLKDFNPALLEDELAASALPTGEAFLAGFVRSSDPNIGTPAAADRVISRDGVAGTVDTAAPGEIRFTFRDPLTVAEGVVLDGLLTAHVATGKTAEQTRRDQDETDLDTLETDFPNFDTFTDPQFKAFVKVLARSYIRDRRNSAF